MGFSNLLVVEYCVQILAEVAERSVLQEHPRVHLVAVDHGAEAFDLAVALTGLDEDDSGRGCGNHGRGVNAHVLVVLIELLDSVLH